MASEISIIISVGSKLFDFSFYHLRFVKVNVERIHCYEHGSIGKGGPGDGP